jgi:hypothetical protein
LPGEQGLYPENQYERISRRPIIVIARIKSEDICFREKPGNTDPELVLHEMFTVLSPVRSLSVLSAIMIKEFLLSEVFL